MSLSEDLIDPAAIPLLREKALRKCAALPLRIEDGRLVLAISDPTNVLTLDGPGGARVGLVILLRTLALLVLSSAAV